MENVLPVFCCKNTGTPILVTGAPVQYYGGYYFECTAMIALIFSLRLRMYSGSDG